MSNYKFVISDLAIYRAALQDDWYSVSLIFEQDPELMTKQINFLGETPLMIGVGTNQSHCFVQKLVESIVAVGDADKLWVTSYGGNNALHYAAKVGNTSDVKILVAQNMDMTRDQNDDGYTPSTLAAFHGNKDTLFFLLTVTMDLVPEEKGSSLYTGVAGGDLITLTIMAGFYDLALNIIDMHPNIVLEFDKNNQTALQALAMKPEFFSSGSMLGFWERFIYSLIPVKKSHGATKVNSFLRIFSKFTAGIWSMLLYVDPAIKNIHDIKVNNIQSSLLVNGICKIVIEKVDHDIAWKIFGSAITTAVTYGTHELIEECILSYPSIIWYNDGGFNLFHAAIKHRQERVYNLVYQMSGHKAFAATLVDHEQGDNVLHIAANESPPHRLKVLPGAAMQMQRELQWFKEVEKFVEPSYREALNKEGKTPRMVFVDAHKELLVQGQKWMKGTASSCTVVAALIVTMTFAAAFKVPGGNKDDGRPLYLDNEAFMLFIISDAIALFFSYTSLLMFLGVLARYAESDFLYTLPHRVIVGLASLFVSAMATLIAFGATLTLVLEDKITWIVAPLVLGISIPVCLFVLLQFPSLLMLVYTTHGPSIFHQQSNKMIY